MPKPYIKTFAEFRGVHFTLKADIDCALQGSRSYITVYRKVGRKEAHLLCNGAPVQIQPHALIIEVQA